MALRNRRLAYNQSYSPAAEGPHSRIVVDPTAWDDLNQIGAWIAKDNPRAARAMLERISANVEQLQ
jgi:ParE toxin of type II toxin-antitoxin system, parDE